MFCLLYNTFQREICLVSFLKSHYNISFVSGFSEAFPGTVSAAFENPRKSKCVLLPSSRTSLRLPGKGKDVSHTLLLGTHRRERAKWDRSEERRATLHSLLPPPPRSHPKPCRWRQSWAILRAGGLSAILAPEPQGAGMLPSYTSSKG